MHRIVLSIDLIERGNICICHDRSRDEIGIKVSRGNINPKNSGRDTRDTGLRGERKGWISVGWITRKKESFLLNDLSRKAREGSISKARPFPRVRSSAQTSVFQDEKIFPYFIRENWYSKHEDEDVVKKKKKSLFPPPLDFTITTRVLGIFTIHRRAARTLKIFITVFLWRLYTLPDFPSRLKMNGK